MHIWALLFSKPRTTLFEATLEICGNGEPCFGGKTAIDRYDRLLLLGSTTAICGVAACTIGSALSLSRNGDVYTAEAMRMRDFIFSCRRRFCLLASLR